MKLYRVTNPYAAPGSRSAPEIVEVEAKETERQYKLKERGWETGWRTVIPKSNMGLWRGSPIEAVGAWIARLESSLKVYERDRERVLDKLAHAGDLRARAAEIEEGS